MSLFVCTSAPVGNDDSTIPLKSVAIISSDILPLMFLSLLRIVISVLCGIFIMRAPRIISLFSPVRYVDCALWSTFDAPLIRRMILR